MLTKLEWVYCKIIIYQSIQNNNKILEILTSFVQLGLNEADTLKSSSILIYSTSDQIIYTQNGWHKAV